MREISPAVNLSAEEFLNLLLPEARQHVDRIRAQKRAGSRPKPSTSLIDESNLLDSKRRRLLLDKVAAFVDESLGGRSDMCIQFADLLERALVHLGIEARSVIGQARYFHNGEEVFRWRHAWVETENEIIDGNIDSVSENPAIPSLKRNPYWGSTVEVPNDREFQEDVSMDFPKEKDVAEIWWPEMKEWLNEKFQQTS
ncbi:transglutaminase domain-containing protein [Candidatus Peregrinibacteria bacterium]|jgi:hypothetical protein|nr:transglutaminase domain-containing protein [Candidatus Peregrinibacteria bacterium]MBT4632403.1 transglutaminase domain-containing protein [Candidatus Peregrinibacteria bacterium]MBT5517037.1 transglutaminase domain-containing protein [Candidatus Peregrinibacteria bacterium]MBT5823606.1 transglutaminase domain-containing protein [Candidatus Peregrinibacteria bacterium]